MKYPIVVFGYYKFYVIYFLKVDTILICKKWTFKWVLVLLKKKKNGYN